MLSAAQSMRVISHQWWLWMPPGLASVLMVLSINLVGEGLSRRLRPSSPSILGDLRPEPLRKRTKTLT